MHDDRFPISRQGLSDEAEMLAGSVARWAEREVVSLRGQHREDFEALHRPALGSLLEQVGLRDLLWPEAKDAPLSATTHTAVLEQVGRADTGLGVVLANTAALQHFAKPGAEDVQGEPGALAALVLPGLASEARAGAAAFHGLAPQVSAREVDGGWELDGTAVRPQCHGAEAARFGIVTTLGDEPALFAVDARTPGLRVGEPFLKTGLNASPNADLVLRGVSVTDAELVLRGEAPYGELLSWYYLGCAAVASGALLATHAILDDWCDSRVIKGRRQPFKDNPLVVSLLGDLGGLVGTGRILTYHLAGRLDQGGGAAEADHATAVAVARTVIRGAMDMLDRAMELMASAGYATEWNLERYWRDIRCLSTYLMLETVGPVALAHHYFGCRNL